MKLTKRLLYQLITETFERYVPQKFSDWVKKTGVEVDEIDAETWKKIDNYIVSNDEADVETAKSLLWAFGIDEDLIDGFFAARDTPDEKEIPHGLYDDTYTLNRYDDEDPTKWESSEGIVKYFMEILEEPLLQAYMKENNIETTDSFVDIKGGANTDPWIKFYVESPDDLEIAIYVHAFGRGHGLPFIYIGGGRRSKMIYQFTAWLEEERKENRAELTGDAQTDTDLIIGMLGKLLEINNLNFSEQRKFLGLPDES